MDTLPVDERLLAMLSEVSAVMLPPREPTLFGVGGRGYLENPTSDLLAFFMRPNEVHGLQSLFLEAFLECMSIEIDAGQSMSGVTVDREVSLDGGGRIDLLVRGGDWALIIENKIYHHQANPFEDYKAYGEQLVGAGRLFLAVLSPDGSTDQRDWIAVSYRDYCRVVRCRLNDPSFAGKWSKWHLFANEFILHLDNELYPPAMTPEQIDFAERHAQALEEATQLQAEYRKYMLETVKREMEAAVPGTPFIAWDDKWALRYRGESWGDSNLALSYDKKAEGWGREITVYLYNLSPEQKGQAQERLRDRDQMRHWTEGRCMVWRTTQRISTRKEVFEEMQRLAILVSDLLTPPDAEGGDGNLA